MYQLKCALNILATLFLIIGGILIILLAWTILPLPPFAVLGNVKPLELILAGSTLIIISLSPLVVAINSINLHQSYNRHWQRQTIRELDGILKNPIKSRVQSLEDFFENEIINERAETLTYCQSETLVQMIQNPMGQWKGEDLYTLIDILDIDNQGNLRYPKTLSTFPPVSGSPIALINNQTLLLGENPAFNPETAHFQKTESLVEILNNPKLMSGQITAASLINVLYLNQIGTLHFPTNLSPCK